jgi:O-glycosyl hydrolase
MNNRKFLWCGAAAVIVLAAFFLSACAMEEVRLETFKHAGAPRITNQPGVMQFTTGDTPTMTVVAESPDGGVLSYQWYSYANGKEYDGLQGDIINGATSASYSPEGPFTDGVTYSYYVIVTNNNNNMNGKKRVAVQSDPAIFVFTNPDNAAFPFITKQPASGIYILKRGLSINLSMSARLASDARGDVTLQWYQVDVLTSEKGTPIEDVTAASFAPSIGSGMIIDGPGNYYFFAVVTNTDMMAIGNKQTTVVSEVAEIIVIRDPDAEMPEISRHPQSQIYFVGDNDDPIQDLTVSALEVEDGGTLNYQWYSNGTNSNTGGTPIDGAGGLMTAAGAGLMSAKLTPPVTNASASVNYYYAVLTNINENVTRTQSVSISSNVAVLSIQSSADKNQYVDWFSTVTVDITDPRQYVRGYGGMDVAWGNFPTYTMADYETMYNPDRLGYNMVRIMVMPQNTDINKTMDDLVGNKLTGSQDRSNFYEFAKLVNRYNGYVLASPWSPPAAWKSNNSVNGGGDLRVSNYPDMAKYLDAFARNMYNNGAPVYAISLQNEPSYTAGYDGCEYTPQQNRNFFLSEKRFLTTPGYGGGKPIERVLQVGGESHNEIDWQSPVLANWDSRDFVDFICRHIYGASTSRYPLAIEPELLPQTNNGPITPVTRRAMANGEDSKEIWMTEHNLNSNNATAYVNDSTWHYVWKFMNDVDFVIRVNEESAFVWWSSKRFYSMLGDGQYGTVDGVVYPRGYGLAHYAKYAKEMGRVGVTVEGVTKNMTTITSERPNAIVNSSTFTSSPTSGGVDSTSVKITAFVKTKIDRSDMVVIDPNSGRTKAHPNGWRLNRTGLRSSDISEITLVMWTPTNTSGASGTDMGGIKIQLPAGFVISNAEAIRSTNGRYMIPEVVSIDRSRNAAYVDLPPSNIVSVRFSNAN